MSIYFTVVINEEVTKNSYKLFYDVILKPKLNIITSNTQLLTREMRWVIKARCELLALNRNKLKDVYPYMAICPLSLSLRTKISRRSPVAEIKIFFLNEIFSP